jgi:hypothetical protein
MSYRLQSEQIKTSNNGTLPGLAFWINSYNEALVNWLQSGDRMLKKAAELSEDIISFSRTQLQTDLDTWQAMVSCRSATDLLECQRQFAQKAGSQCLDQAGKLASRMSTLIADTALSPPREQTLKATG